MIRFLNATGALLVAVTLIFSAGCAAPAAPTPGSPQAKVGTVTTPTRQAEPTTTVTPTEVPPTATAVPTVVTPPATMRPGLQVTPQVTPSTSPGTPPAGSIVPTQADVLLEEAKKDAARRAGVPVSEVTVVKAEAVEWRDSSLGCPEPGKSYLQVITPGYRFTLRAGGNSYEYHTDRGNRVVLCQNPS